MKYVTGAFPSACGKTNLAMLIPTLPGWKVETIGDDIAWMKFGADGRLYAINPEAGFFGVAPGTSIETNPNAMRDHRGGHGVHEHRADRRRRRLVGGDDPDRPAHALDWHGQDWTPEADHPAAHPNARFTVPAAQAPVDRAELGGPGGRADRRLPLRRAPRVGRPARARGVRLGARRVPGRDDELGDRPPPPSATVGQLRCDPFAMLPFCGYNMADYFEHWLEVGETDGAKLPKIFYVNWFRKDADGQFLWPGFGENSRVLEWVFRRCDGEGEAVETPIGLVPAEGDLNTDGLDLDPAALRELLTVDEEAAGPSSRRSRSTWRASATTCPRPSARSSRTSGAGSAPEGSGAAA